MFEIITINDVIDINGGLLHNYQAELTKKIREKFEYKPLKNYGFCIKVLGVKTSDGHIQDGDILYSVIIEILSFQPFQSELVYGTIFKSSKEGLKIKFLENNNNDKQYLVCFVPKDQLLNASFDEKTQLWICNYEKINFLYLLGEEVRFKVHSLNFDTADQMDQIIQGRMNESGLGGLTWWV
ncbi:unnamed protein product [Paramecium octaurelia]|uniref:Uncharacterized protein n=1 Tax=Paramecium octaurelia TaxID=43137 RepID=A0A8S1SR97_PAROT|nr:unnamed protein product [Paramecium octaurelia]